MVITYDGKRQVMRLSPDRAEDLGESLNRAAVTARNNRRDPGNGS